MNGWARLSLVALFVITVSISLLTTETYSTSGRLIGIFILVITGTLIIVYKTKKLTLPLIQSLERNKWFWLGFIILLFILEDVVAAVSLSAFIVFHIHNGFNNLKGQHLELRFLFWFSIPSILAIAVVIPRLLLTDLELNIRLPIAILVLVLTVFFAVKDFLSFRNSWRN